MAKDLDFKQVKSLIKEYQECFNALSLAKVDKNYYNQQIRLLYDIATSSGSFEKVFTSEIRGLDVKYDSKINDLLLDMYKYITLKIGIENTQLSIDDMRNYCSEYIYDLRNVNALKWIFINRIKKDRIIEEFSKLLDYKENDNFINASTFANSFNDLKYAKEEDAIYDLTNDNKNYYSIVEYLIKKSKAPQNLATSISGLFNRLEGEKGNFQKAFVEYSKRENRIKEAVQAWITSETLKLLQDITIETASREIKGLRVKNLIENGYTTMADVFASNRYNISSINGISEDTAERLKRLAQENAQELAKGIKIKLNADKRDKYSTEIVVAISKFLVGQEHLKTIEELNKKYAKPVEYAKEQLNDKNLVRKWIFLSIDEKERYKSFYRYLSSAEVFNYFADYSKALNNYLSIRKRVTEDSAWEEFINNPIEFNNVISKLFPDLVGGVDSLYNLPEDLARSIQEECFYPDGLLCTLRPYQEWGVKYILHQERVLLGDEMGLGKTVQAIASMVSLRNTGATKFVVVCPASVASNWVREIHKHSKLKAYMVHGAHKKNIFEVWKKNGGVAVTTFETTSVFELEDDYRIDEIVVDEAHYIKNEKATRTRNTRQLIKYAKRVLLMTGTPLENKVDEMIDLIGILNPGVAMQAESKASIYQSEQFRKIIAPVYYRRKREDVLTELPEMIESQEWVSMNKIEREAYIESLRSANNLMKVRRVSFNVDNLNDSSKANRLKELIDEAKEDERKIVVFSYFLDTLHKLYDFIGSDRCLPILDGSLKPEKRLRLLDELEQSQPGTVLLAQITSGGVGLNIQSASVVIICEPQYKPSTENQAISRSYRMGQARNVLVYKLLTENSVDEEMIKILEEKQREFDAFADKSIAAQSVEINDSNMKDIIKSEIERIKGIKETETEQEIKIQKWDKAKETYRGDPVSVTNRIEHVSQPYGGYINPKEMETSDLSYDGMGKLYEEENISPGIVGITVDYLTRYMLGSSKEDAFKISLFGASLVPDTENAKKYLGLINELSDLSIIGAVNLAKYDVVYRAGIEYYDSKELVPSPQAINNIREMVNRTLELFKEQGPVIASGFTFEGGYTRVIGAGDADYLTKDTLWDLKTSKKEPDRDDTLQLLIYYLLGTHSNDKDMYKDVKYLGIYNSRFNKIYKYEISKITKETIQRIEEEIIGY